MHRNQVFLAIFATLGLLSLAGCGKADKIEHYTVRKPVPYEPPRAKAHPDTPVESPGEPTRTLAAIVPHDEQGWFFKITGPDDAVAAQSAPFDALLKSVRFSESGKPEWELPEGWQQRRGSDIRFATLVIPSVDPPLEVSVTALPKATDDEAQYALMNVNRWRGQLSLPPIALEQLSTETRTIELDGATATVVDLLGTAAPNSMGRPPFMRGAGNGN